MMGPNKIPKPEQELICKALEDVSPDDLPDFEFAVATKPVAAVMEPAMANGIHPLQAIALVIAGMELGYHVAKITSLPKEEQHEATIN